MMTLEEVINELRDANCNNSHYDEEKQMIKDFLEDIENAKEKEAYYSALALALTMPDFCGKIQYNVGNDRDKYIRWFNEWIYKYVEIPESKNKDFVEFDKLAQFDGKTCYALRCAYLYCGTVNLKEDATMKVSLDRFELCICEGEWQGGEGHGCMMSYNEITEVHRRFNIVNLLDAFLNGIKDYLEAYGDNSKRYGNVKIIKF